jgi:hypothetical protein
MTKRILISIFTGILFGILLAAAPGVNAQEGPCYGLCPAQRLRNDCVSEFAGCAMNYDEYGNLDYVTCFFVNTCVGDIKDM